MGEREREMEEFFLFHLQTRKYIKKQTCLQSSKDKLENLDDT